MEYITVSWHWDFFNQSRFVRVQQRMFFSQHIAWTGGCRAGFAVPEFTVLSSALRHQMQAVALCQYAVYATVCIQHFQGDGMLSLMKMFFNGTRYQTLGQDQTGTGWMRKVCFHQHKAQPMTRGNLSSSLSFRKRKRKVFLGKGILHFLRLTLWNTVSTSLEPEIINW